MQEGLRISEVIAAVCEDVPRILIAAHADRDRRVELLQEVEE